MATVRDIVTRAHRKIGVTAFDEEISGSEVQNGTDALNAMMHAWKLHGADITHVDVTANDDFPIGPEFEEGAVYMLASRISSDFMVPAGFDADAWFRGIQAAYTEIDTVTLPTTLLHLPSGARRDFS